MKTIMFETLLDTLQDSARSKAEFFLDGQHVIQWDLTAYSITLRVRRSERVLYVGSSTYRFPKNGNEQIPVDEEGNLLLKWELDNGRSTEAIEATLFMYLPHRFD